MSMLPPVFIELRANISEFSTKMGEARTEVATLEKEGSSSFNKVAAVGKAALLGIAAAGAGVGVMSIELADKFETAHVKLETAIKNTGGSYEEYQKQIKAASDASAQFGYNTADTENALGILTTSLKDPELALKDLSMAQDLAKYKGISLADASTAVAKAQEGNLRPLKQLGIDLPIAASGALKLEQANTKLSAAQDKLKAFLEANPSAMDKNNKKHAEYLALAEKVSVAQQNVNDKANAGKDIMAGLGAAIGGQATAQSKTFGGQMAALKSETENVFTAIGMKLIPVLLKMIEDFKAAWNWASKHKDIMIVLAAAIAGPLLVAIGAYIAAMAVAAAETLAAALPFIAIGAAIATLILAIIYLKNHWREMLQAVKDDLSAAANWIGDKFDAIKTKFSDIWSGMGDVVKKVFSGIADIVKGYFNIYIKIINSVIDQLDKISIKVPNGIPLIGGKTFAIDIPNIPYLANGGLVSSPTVAMIGEVGPEAVIPLSRMDGMGGVNVTVNVSGSVIQERDLAVTVRDNIAQLMRRRGLNPSILGV